MRFVVSLAGLAGLAGLAFPASAGELDDRRSALAAELTSATSEAARDRIRARARGAILENLDRVVTPAWLGTPWSKVGCSAFVAGVLTDLGFRLSSRRRFVEAPALVIQRSLAPRDDQVHRFVDIDGDQLAARVAALGDGLYLIGLRYHVGFVRVRGDRVELVHSGRDGPATVRAEPLELAAVVIASRPTGYWVTPALPSALIDRWLLGKKVSLDGAPR